MPGMQSDAVLWYCKVREMQMVELWVLGESLGSRRCHIPFNHEPCVLTTTRIDMCRC